MRKRECNRIEATVPLRPDLILQIERDHLACLNKVRPRTKIGQQLKNEAKLKWKKRIADKEENAKDNRIK